MTSARAWTAAALAAGWLLVACDGGGPASPPGKADVVILGAEQKVYAGTLAGAGQQVVFGAAIAENKGEFGATLLDARLIGDVPAAGAEVVDLRVKPLTTGDSDIVAAGLWPFEDYPAKSVALEDYRLAPGSRVELLYIVEVKREEVLDWPEIGLTFEAGDQRQETTATTGLRICPLGEDDCASQSPPSD